MPKGNFEKLCNFYLDITPKVNNKRIKEIQVYQCLVNQKYNNEYKDINQTFEGLSGFSKVLFCIKSLQGLDFNKLCKAQQPNIIYL